MSLWFTKTSEGMKGWLSLRRGNGLPRTGATSGSFTTTVVNPGDTATNSPTVTESATTPGLYTFTVPTAFLSTHGTGVYAVYMVVDTGNPQRVRDVKSWPLRVTTRDLDSVLDVVVDTGDGGKTANEALQYLLSMASGAFDEATLGNVKTYAFKDRAGGALFTLSIDTDAGTRDRTLG